MAADAIDEVNDAEDMTGPGLPLRSLYRHHRAHSEDVERQQIDMLGLAGLINALTRERMRRAALPAAA